MIVYATPDNNLISVKTFRINKFMRFRQRRINYFYYYKLYKKRDRGSPVWAPAAAPAIGTDFSEFGLAMRQEPNFTNFFENGHFFSIFLQIADVYIIYKIALTEFS